MKQKLWMHQRKHYSGCVFAILINLTCTLWSKLIMQTKLSGRYHFFDSSSHNMGTWMTDKHLFKWLLVLFQDTGTTQLKSNRIFSTLKGLPMQLSFFFFFNLTSKFYSNFNSSSCQYMQVNHKYFSATKKKERNTCPVEKYWNIS